MKKCFITFVLFCFCSITFSKDYTFVVGEPLLIINMGIIPGTIKFPREIGATVLSEVKLTGEGKGFFRIYAALPSRELTYNIEIGDKFYLHYMYSYYFILPYKGTETLYEGDQIWTVKDIQDNLITFEEQ